MSGAKMKMIAITTETPITQYRSQFDLTMCASSL